MVLFVAGIAIVRTDWFRNMVREKIVAAVEEGTGGRAEIGSFEFDWTHLRAKVSQLRAARAGAGGCGAAVARGSAAGGFEAALAVPRLRGYRLPAGGEAAGQRDRVGRTGTTNVPSPKVPGKGDKTALETVVDLAIGKFDLRNGSVDVRATGKTPLDASGENLRAQLGFNQVTSRYTGEMDMSPLYVNRLRVDVKLPVTLEKDRIGLDNAWLRTPKSRDRDHRRDGAPGCAADQRARGRARGAGRSEADGGAGHPAGHGARAGGGERGCHRRRWTMPGYHGAERAA